MGFHARAAHGRIDDANADWKGRRLWSSDMTYTAWHLEGGQGSKPLAIKFQVRPDPLAKQGWALAPPGYGSLGSAGLVTEPFLTFSDDKPAS